MKTDPGLWLIIATVIVFCAATVTYDLWWLRRQRRIRQELFESQSRQLYTLDPKEDMDFRNWIIDDEELC